MVVDLSAFENFISPDTGIVMVAGESTGLKPGTLYEFSSAPVMKNTCYSGNLADMADALFRPSNSDGIEGATKVLCVSTNANLQALGYDVAPAGDAIKLKATHWGVPGNYTKFKITAGTLNGKVISARRDTDPDRGEQISPEIGRDGQDSWFSITYTGAAVDMKLAVTPTGDLACTSVLTPGDNLTVTLAAITTIEELVAIINLDDKFTANILRGNRRLINPSELDKVAAIAMPAATAVEVKGINYDVIDWITTSSVYLEAERGTVDTVMANVAAYTFLTGGTLGVSTTSTIDTALALLKKLPSYKFASGYSTDIGAGGVVTIETVNTKIVDWAKARNAVLSNYPVQLFLAYFETGGATLDQFKTHCITYNYEYASICTQEVYKENSFGVVSWLGPHVQSAMACGMMAGSPWATPITHKYLNCYDVRNKSTWDPEDDFPSIVQFGGLVAEKISGKGWRFVKGISCYTLKENDAYQSLECMESACLMKVQLKEGIEALFVGTKGKGIVSANAILTRIEAILSYLSDQRNPDFLLVEGTDEQGRVVPAYRNFVVSVSGKTVTFSGDVTFSMGIDFIVGEVFGYPPIART